MGAMQHASSRSLSHAGIVVRRNACLWGAAHTTTMQASTPCGRIQQKRAWRSPLSYGKNLDVHQGRIFDALIVTPSPLCRVSLAVASENNGEFEKQCVSSRLRPRQESQRRHPSNGSHRLKTHRKSRKSCRVFIEPQNLRRALTWACASLRNLQRILRKQREVRNKRENATKRKRRSGSAVTSHPSGVNSQRAVKHYF